MAVKTRMRVDEDRFMDTLPQVGDTFLELVKNALEAEGCTNVRITLVLHGDEPRLVVQNDGVPFKSVEEVQKYLLTVFTTGKNNNLNWGKGFTTVLKELRTFVESGNLTIDILSHRDITIDTSIATVNGTRVTVYLKDKSELKERQLDKYIYLLNNFVTSKAIYFNNDRMDVCSFHEDKTVKLEAGLAIGHRGSFTYRGIPSITSYFLMPDGGHAPIDIKGMDLSAFNIIVSDIKHMDTERVALNWHAEYTIRNWVSAYRREHAPDLKDNEGVGEWIEKASSWVIDLVSPFVARKVDANIFGMSTRDIATLSKLVTRFNSIAERVGVEPFSTPFPGDKETIATISSLRESISEGNMREFIKKCFGMEGIELLAKLVIGVMIADGSVDGSAMLQDLVLVKCRVADIADKTTWIPLHMNLAPYIATYMDLDFLASTTSVDFATEARKITGGVNTEQPDPKKVIQNTDPRKIDVKTVDMTAEEAREQFEELVEKAKIACREQNITEHDQDVAEQYEDTEDIESMPDWRYEEYNGVPCLVNKSVPDMEKIQFTVETQMKKWKSWMGVCKLVGSYTGDMFTSGFVPVIMVSDGIMKDCVAFKDGLYVALNRVNTKIPKGSALRAGLWMTILVIHEFVHFKRTVHDKQFCYLEEDTFMALLQDERYLQDLKKVVEVF